MKEKQKKSKNDNMIFNTEMIAAIRSGRKTQTRRLMPEWQTPTYNNNDYGEYYYLVAQRDARYGFGFSGKSPEECIEQLIKTKSCCPYARIHSDFEDNYLLARETWGIVSNVFDENGNAATYTPDRPTMYVTDMEYGKQHRKKYTGHIIYKADGEFNWSSANDRKEKQWRSSMLMPNEIGRTFLKVTGFKVERLQDISREDAIAEGIQYDENTPPEVAFKNIWIKLYGQESWDANPYVWVICFNLKK